MTSALERCDSCNGRKKVLGMGGMMKDCLTCEGIGWLSPSDSEKKRVNIQGVTNIKGEPVIVKKKPGRKPKVVAFNL